MNADKYIQTQAGRALFELLPEVYRTRDTIDPEPGGDLARYLDACGHLLDLIRRTMDQRLADVFPDDPPAELGGQPWLLPYIADLLDVHMVSPDEAGRRAEVAHAVAWRQRKGTLKVLEQIAEQVGRLEVEVQEGWKKVATTPRIGLPLLPARARGASERFDDFRRHANWAARHPDLNSATIDLRYPSRAVQLDGAPQNPAAKQTDFGGTTVWWRQVNPHGAPCFPGSYEDTARRTVDVRTPHWRQGHCHPKRAVLYAPPPTGFFPLPRPIVAISPDPDQGALDYQPCGFAPTAYCAEFPLRAQAPKISAGSRGLLRIETETGSNVTLPVAVTAATNQALSLKGPAPPKTLTVPVPSERVKLEVLSAVTIRWDRRGELRYQSLFEERREARSGLAAPVRVFFNQTLGTEWYMPIKIIGRIELAEVEHYRFEGLHLDNALRVDQGRLELEAVAARRVDIATRDTELPVLDARDSLIKNMLVPDGLVRLEYCTVLENAPVEALEASDSLFLGLLFRSGGSPSAPPRPACLRYARFHERQPIDGMHIYQSTRDPVVMWTTEFGRAGCGVLHPATSGSVRFGAEDGGEMGAYHTRKYALLAEAVQDKLKGFLPVGIEAVVVPDLRLQVLPRESCNTGESQNEA